MLIRFIRAGESQFYWSFRDDKGWSRAEELKLGDVVILIGRAPDNDSMNDVMTPFGLRRVFRAGIASRHPIYELA